MRGTYAPFWLSHEGRLPLLSPYHLTRRLTAIPSHRLLLDPLPFQSPCSSHYLPPSYPPASAPWHLLPLPPVSFPSSQDPRHSLAVPPALLLLTPIVITFEQLSLPSSRSWCLFTCLLSADPCAGPLYILWLLALPSPYQRYCVLTPFIDPFFRHHYPVLHVIYMYCPPPPCRRSHLYPDFFSWPSACVWDARTLITA
ncbi:hypothetical protein EDB85DRAFT_1253507 [Lactarius pseudohatsudake]|nr:hypothetical protein EDB85DRAFT_1253507 [Lactarius pseudohatsudake]